MKQREFFIKHINQYLIGPGANENIFGFKAEDELLDNYPLQTYYSGILFPEIEQPNSYGQNSDTNTIADAIEKDAKNEEPPKNIEEDAEQKENIKNSKEIESTNSEANSYFPSNNGLTFCVGNETKDVNVTFSAGRYVDISKKKEEIKIKIDKNDFDKLKNTSNEYHFEFSENINYDPINEKYGWLLITKEISENVSATKHKISNYKKKIKDLKVINPYEDRILRKFDLITSGVYFKRVNLIQLVTIKLLSDNKFSVTNAEDKEIEIDTDENSFPVFEGDDNKVIAKCFVKIIPENGRKYVKLLLANTSPKHPRNKFSFGKEVLNEKCLFQTKIEVDTKLHPYKNNLIENKYDFEASLINYQYRNLNSYGIGQSCAVQWKGESPTRINTTFLPKVKVRSVSNNFRKGNEHFKEIANIKNLSVWTSFNRETICKKLTEFVKGYDSWIITQENLSKKEPEHQKYAKGLIKGQKYNSQRLHKNIEILKNNADVFDAFILTNTAMYIQMIISVDDKFGKKEKELTDFDKIFKEDKNINYKSLDYFKDYKPKRPIIYYPFQLSFLLLNIESITDIKAPDRNNIVDLLWFPTGGGKTEAYLAVTALTIIWRRLKNPDNFEGVSVIMRYTLRLLTAQQFERASKLIVALEFMNRYQTKIPTNYLCASEINFGNPKTSISIGMWVGGATTPNKLADAKDEINGTQGKTLKTQIDELNRTNKKPKNADSVINSFQVTACPWCGCKTITKNPKTGKFLHAFYVDKTFKIECLNSKCEFSNKIPIDVVDDSLYIKPPTLLFATVDKFAQLSHREEGNVFFNSLNDNIPPDLIIQDELHLLNGPLGSIVGLFELIIESLSTKEDYKPKIIASTATTRNTQKQVGNLYGNRIVNIFPPQGLTYDDNYFSFTDTEKTGQRLHIGFMPTGKTSIDTQVRAILPNLLLARILLYKMLKIKHNKETANDLINNYWTIVSYYNSLKDVGKIYNKVNDEILSGIKRLHEQFGINNYLYNFNHYGLINRTKELTSRIESTKIKNYLNELQANFQLKQSISKKNEKYDIVKDTVDIVLASNMFSVGIDISRLNIMLMNGQPKNIAEYIQASGRVARKHDGLVINLLDANRAREKSYFEHYLPFHEAYYKYVEPLTVTPFTAITFEKSLNSILISFVRHKKGLFKNENAHEFSGDITELEKLISDRIPKDETGVYLDAKRILDKLKTDWLNKIDTVNNTNIGKQEKNKTKLRYKDLIEKSQKQGLWSLMNSMREVDTNSLIEISLNHSTTINNEKENMEQE